MAYQQKLQCSPTNLVYTWGAADSNTLP